MKRKLIFLTFALTTIMLTGCSQNSAQGAENAPSTSASPQATEQTSTTSQAEATAQPQTTTQSQTDNTNNAGMISEEEAKQIALTHAGLTVDQTTFIKSDIDRDNGRLNYDVEFYSNDQKEYDYEIDPYTGDILDYDYDVEY